MTEAPLNVRRFEALQLTSIIIGLINQFAVIASDIFDALIGAAVLVALTLLISRGRKHWAKWVLVGLTVLGLAIMAWNASAVLEMGYPAITLAVTLMQVVALALLFTPQFTSWLSKDPSLA